MFARMSSQHPLHLHASGLSCRFNRSPQRGHRARIRDCLLIAEAAIPARKHELSGGNDRSRRHPTFVKIEATSRQRTKPDPRRCTTIRCAQCSIDNSDAPRHGASSRKRPFTTTRILYIASSGSQWRMLPKDFPPISTVEGCFYAWRDGFRGRESTICR